MEDTFFISQLRIGDPSAYNELINQFGDKVFNTALGILQNKEDAEDITQEVFVKVFKAIADFKEKSKLSTWIYRITLTQSLEFLRKQKRKKRFAFVQQVFGFGNVFPMAEKSSFYHPGVQLENKERSAILFQAINRLIATQKTAFLLHKIEGLSYAEIAEIMRISVSSVESLIFRAKQNLQNFLSDYYLKNER